MLTNAKFFLLPNCIATYSFLPTLNIPQNYFPIQVQQLLVTHSISFSLSFQLFLRYVSLLLILFLPPQHTGGKPAGVSKNNVLIKIRMKKLGKSQWDEKSSMPTFPRIPDTDGMSRSPAKATKSPGELTMNESRIKYIFQTYLADFFAFFGGK